ncbi:hypothetical protein ACLK19_01745 [Escherichia coli]
MTIGDGLVAQIPSLLLSTAAADARHPRRRQRRYRP